jgi:HSP20 family protein
MPNITVRRNNGGQMARHASTWEPFRIMRDLMAWEPFRRLSPIGWDTSVFVPAFEVKETEQAYLLNADVPGIKKEDLQIALAGRVLTVRGKREAAEESKAATYSVFERSYGSFTRSFTLPDLIDDEHITADLRDGVLTISVPKKAGAMPRKIELTSSEEHASQASLHGPS